VLAQDGEVVAVVELVLVRFLFHLGEIVAWMRWDLELAL